MSSLLKGALKYGVPISLVLWAAIFVITWAACSIGKYVLGN
jgi:hypothetical protein